MQDIPRRDIEKTKRYSIKDGSAWSVMYGFAEQYITPFALRLGATDSQIGILASVPAFIGSIFQLLGAKLTEEYRNRKKIVTFLVLIQALLMLPLFFLPFLTRNILVLTILFTFYNIIANLIGPNWSSWIADLVSENDRARYFGIRNKYVVASTMFSVAAAGLILHFMESVDIWAGFAILFAVAFIGRMVSWYYLKKCVEIRYEYTPEDYFSIKEFFRSMTKTNFGNFVMFRSMMSFAVMIASPFLAVFVLEELRYTYLQYMIIMLMAMATKVIAMRYWGKYSQKFGTRNIMIVSGLGISLIPIWWFFAGYFFSPGDAFYILLLGQAAAGFAWAGFELTTFNYVIETVPSERRSRGFAYYNVLLGTAVLLGGLLGAVLVDIIPAIATISALMTVFVVSVVARLLVMLAFSSRIHEVRVSRQVNENRLFFELIIAKPVNNALHHTSAGILKTESNVRQIMDKTEDAIERWADPVRPYIEGFVDVVDEELQKVERTIDDIYVGNKPYTVDKKKPRPYKRNKSNKKKYSRKITKKRR